MRAAMEGLNVRFSNWAHGTREVRATLTAGGGSGEGKDGGPPAAGGERWEPGRRSSGRGGRRAEGRELPGAGGSGTLHAVAHLPVREKGKPLQPSPVVLVYPGAGVKGEALQGRRSAGPVEGAARPGRAGVAESGRLSPASVPPASTPRRTGRPSAATPPPPPRREAATGTGALASRVRPARRLRPAREGGRKV